MSSFKGSDIYSVDAKGRVSIPSKMRRNISPEANSTFVVTRGLEKCLYGYPLDEWHKLETSIKALNQTSEEDRFSMRMLLQYSEELALDGQFRILIPRSLLDYAEIKKEVYIIGVLDHIELWDPANFKRYIDSMKKSYETVAESVLGLRASEPS
ncbi:MAG: division/cell wall cluster transcriptional repressor MraZ [Bacteroidetes bacterium]|jgi:MraZ protein|nr:division/cell wall cluster transcriptional repressor MraZ [Bacteroidota bacterium]